MSLLAPLLSPLAHYSLCWPPPPQAMHTPCRLKLPNKHTHSPLMQLHYCQVFPAHHAPQLSRVPAGARTRIAHTQPGQTPLPSEPTPMPGHPLTQLVLCRYKDRQTDSPNDSETEAISDTCTRSRRNPAMALSIWKVGNQREARLHNGSKKHQRTTQPHQALGGGQSLTQALKSGTMVEQNIGNK